MWATNTGAQASDWNKNRLNSCILTPVSAQAMCLFPGPESYLEANKNTAVANGTDVITVTAHAGCLWEGVWSYSNNDPIRLVVTGANVTPSQQNNGRAAVSFSIVSTTAGNKSVQMQVYGPLDLDNPVDTWNDIGPAINLSFTAQVTEKPAAKTTPKTTVTTEAVTAPTTSTPIAAPTISKINDEDVTSAKTYNKSQPITLTGKAAPNSTVKLYIHSELKTAETRADANGDWSYEITGLEPGDHRVEAEVIDESGSASEKIEIAAFSVVEVANAEDGQVSDDRSNLIYIIASFGLLVVISLSILFVLKKRKSKSLRIHKSE